MPQREHDSQGSEGVGGGLEKVIRNLEESPRSLSSVFSNMACVTHLHVTLGPVPVLASALSGRTQQQHLHKSH